MASITPITGNKSSQAQVIPSNTKPTMVLVHGAWQSSVVWTYVTALLERAGYSVFPVNLPSPGATPMVPDFSCDVDMVRNAIESLLEAGKDVILGLHSYGGVVGCEALKYFHTEITHSSKSEYSRTEKVSATGSVSSDDPIVHFPRRGKILHIAFIAALVIPKGATVWHKDKQDPAGFSMADHLIKILDGPERMYNDISTVAAEYWNSRLRVQSESVFFTPLTYPAYRHYPCSYLVCTDDNAIPLKVQQRMALLASVPADRMLSVKAGHSPMISQPGVVSKFLRKIAGEKLSPL